MDKSGSKSVAGGQLFSFARNWPLATAHFHLANFLT
jgi:hypothetical protein